MKERKGFPSLFFIFFFFAVCVFFASAERTPVSLSIGVVLDLEEEVGRMSRASISLALDDFYISHADYSTRIQLIFRDSKKDVVGAASEALDLLKNEHVQAIIGPFTSSQAEFVANLGNKSRVPIVSFTATSPSISPSQSPYFLRTTLDDSLQVKPIASLLKLFGWRDVAPIYEATRYGAGIIPYLVDAVQDINGRIPYRSVIQPSATNEEMTQELYKLKTMPTRVFIVHMSADLGARFFLLASQLGMVDEDYVWILTDGITNRVDSMDSSNLESMQGVIGVRPFVPGSMKLNDFKRRWRRKYWQLNPEEEATDPTIYSLRAYDTLWALAMAAERLDLGKIAFKRTEKVGNFTDLGIIDVSQLGDDFKRSIEEVEFEGLAGNFQLLNGELQSSVFEIVNVNGKLAREVGYWKEGEISRWVHSREINSPGELPILWPGERKSSPKGWVIPTSGKKLRIGVPVKDGFQEFVTVKRSPDNDNRTIITGFCIDVFDAVMKNMPYSVPYEYFPFEDDNGKSAWSYNDLVNEVAEQRFDAVVGDTTILANRSKSVDFTLPFTESGWTMIVRVKKEDKSGWIFVKPWKSDLWVASFVFFVFTGFVVWIIEHRVNPDFRGPPGQHLGRSFYFTFSTMVFSHRENVVSNLSRIVIVVWIFVVLILQSSFTANLASLLTIQKLEPAFTDVHELLNSGHSVGYQEGSFIYAHLKNIGFPESRIKSYENPDEYAKALSDGTANGGVAAIFDEIPYIKVFLYKYCSDYTMAGPVYKANGFGFVFAKGSPLVRDVSSAILSTTEGEEMSKIQKTWLEAKATCSSEKSEFSSSRLSLKSFAGLFYITGAVSAVSLFLFLADFFLKNRGRVGSEEREDSVWKRATSKAAAWAKHFDKGDLALVRREESRRRVGEGSSHGGNSNEEKDSFSSIDLESPRTPGVPTFRSIEITQAR